MRERDQPPAGPETGPDQRLGVSLEHVAAALEAVRRTAEREDDDRSWIARTIIVVFVGTIVAGLSILTLEGWMTGDWTRTTAQVTDLIKSAVLPVVTLVLGYYFGRSGRS